MALEEMKMYGSCERMDVVVHSGACVCALPLNAAAAFPLRALESTDKRTFRSASGSTIEAIGTRRPQVLPGGTPHDHNDLYGAGRQTSASRSIEDSERRKQAVRGGRYLHTADVGGEGRPSP